MGEKAGTRRFAVHTYSEPLKSAADSYLTALRFFFTAKHDILRYYRSVLMSAMLPLLYDVLVMALPGALRNYEIGPIYEKAATFSGVFALCYSGYILRTLLFPREKTFGVWSGYMAREHSKLDQHVKSTLTAFYKQLVRESGSVAESAVWTNAEVRRKYVNFCWKFTYRTWCETKGIALAKRQTVFEVPRSATTERPVPKSEQFISDKPTGFGEDLHGDVPGRPHDSPHEVPAQPLNEQRFLTNLAVLRRISNRIYNFSSNHDPGKRLAASLT